MLSSLTRHAPRTAFYALLIGSLFFVSAFLPRPQFAAGATITVNSTSEVTNGSDGLCTLREAITAANTNSASGATAGECAAGSNTDSDTIDATGISGTIDLTTALPGLSSDLSINGPGANSLTVQRSMAGGTPQFRIFFIQNPATAVISGLTIANGNPANGNHGGGVLNNGTLTLTNCNVYGNSVTTSPSNFGGGIYTTGPSLTLNNSNIGGIGINQANSATDGGGIYNLSGTVVVNGGSIAGNSGGGISNSSTLNLTNVSVTNNVGIVNGLTGGVSNSPLGVATITNCLIANNSALTTGGGVHNTGTTRLINTTISGNSSSGNGGGITNQGSIVGSPNINLTNVTITNNRSDFDNSGGEQGGGIHVAAGTVLLKNTIVAANNRGSFGSTADDISGTVSSSSSFNLIGAGGAGGLTAGVNSNQVGVSNSNIRLGSLANNGGPTLTHAPLLGSPAIDAADNCVLTNSCSHSLPSALSTDQRGFNRAADGNGDDIDVVDIGAHEVQSILVTNTNNAGAGSLRQAITDANVSQDANFIKFQAGVIGTITLATELPTISTSMTIRGPGANQVTVSGNNFVRVFNLLVSATGAVNISGLTVANGAGGSGSGVLNNFTGSVNLSNVVMTGNSVGSAVYNANSGSIVIRNSVFTNNSGGNGGAVFNTFNGAVTIINSSFSQNTASSTGGAVSNQSLGTVNVVNCTLSQNSADAAGAISNSGGGTLTVLNTTLTGNVARIGVGGAISNNFGNITLTHSTVSQNSGVGGGVYNASGVVQIKNTIVAGNTSNPATDGPDLKRDFVSQGYNIIGKSDGSTGFTNGVNNDQVGTAAAPVNALLSPLANNGGAAPDRFTMLPLPGSTAINAGNISNLPADTFDLDNDGNIAEVLPVDQRGFARVIGANFDIGAVETNYSISTTGGSGQSAVIKSDFSAPLLATVQESNLVKSGISVTFTTPGSGASATFPGGGTSISVVTDASGIATSPTLTANGTPGGPYNVTASLTSNLASTTFSLTNLKADTFTAVTSSVNPSAEGQNVTFTATVTSPSSMLVGTPTGTVQFKDGGVNIGSAVVLNVSGVATLSISSLTLGTHTITAEYSGDANFNSSSGTLIGGQVVGGVIQFSQTSYTVDESSNFLSITVTRTGSTSGPVTVKYATSDATDVNFVCNPNTAGQITGAASRKCDYHIAAGRLRFAAGETSKTIVLSLVNDVYVEGAEALTISLSSATGAVLGTPNIATVTINDNPAEGGANPIDGTAFYVRMLYVDLLSREPDPAGFAGWIHRIDFCGQPGEPPPPCDRVTVGGDGFLRSVEFFDREFFVIRLYRSGLGRILRYDDVGDLAFVSGFLTDADLELNKQEVVTDIMSRPEFGNIYNGLSNTQYVDTLIQTAAVTLPAGVRDDWVNALNGATKTRAQVFRELSERSEVSARYLNEARVVSCYYGFFTRNPDAAYFNFLDRLDRGEINLGDLANAFINAAEYRQRFGP